VNVDAVPIREGATARGALERQVSRPVLWEDSVQRMIAEGVTLFVEVGPGKVLTGLVGRISKEVRALSVQSPADFEAARAAIEEARS